MKSSDFSDATFDTVTIDFTLFLSAVSIRSIKLSGTPIPYLLFLSLSISIMSEPGKLPFIAPFTLE